MSTRAIYRRRPSRASRQRIAVQSLAVIVALSSWCWTLSEILRCFLAR